MRHYNRHSGFGRPHCYACDRALRGDGYLVTCRDDQQVYVGPDCFRHVKRGGADGWQPPLGGPRLFTLDHKPETIEETEARLDAEAALSAPVPSPITRAAFMPASVTNAAVREKRHER